MFGLPLVFTVPFVLIALAGLPALYFLLRIVPPRPRRVPFPPLRLILDLRPKEETPVRTPWWILLLRLAIAALVIFAMAGPILNPLPAGEAGEGPLIIVIDDGWPAAPSWDDRVSAAAQRIEAAGRYGRLAAVVPTSDAGREIFAAEAGRALERLRAIKPVPYIPDRLASFPAIEKFIAAKPKAALVFVADSVERGNGRAFAQKLAGLNVPLTLVADHRPVRILTAPRNEGSSLNVRVSRSAARGAEQGQIEAFDLKGARMGEAAFDFASMTEANAQFELPVELRNEIARLEIAGEHSTGAVTLLDERWKRRRVDIVSGETADLSLPLLSPNYYLLRALSPYADVHEINQGAADPVSTAIDEHPAVLILADIGVVSGATHEKLAQFVEDGGLLLRFAGTHLASASDDLVPVQLRRGGRILGGSLSWETPKTLAPFERQSPFFGLKTPDEVTISRQVLAEPDSGLPNKTWAQLSDGTPLVTAEQRGKGMIVLFHVTADTTWSNLPLSGLFVDMLRKIVALSTETAKDATGKAAAGNATAGEKTILASPRRTLDGFGLLGAPPATAKSIPSTFNGVGDAEHPPGFYGPPDALLAVNALAPDDVIEAADYTGLHIQTEALRTTEPVDLRPWLISLAFVLFLIDALASLWLAGGLRRTGRRAVATVLLVACCGYSGMGWWSPAQAQPAKAITEPLSPNARESVLETRLAYVLTGDSRVDQVSQEGLSSLSRVLAARTSLTPGDPIGLNLAQDELAFYPLLYWPIVPGHGQPTAAVLAKVATFMKEGGTIIFDTRDALTARSGGPPTAEGRWLKQMLEGLDVPELEPVPPDHVVTKTFYLLDGFIGRYANGQTWIEALPPAPADGSARPARSGDGVSPIIITSNDLAAGWASDRVGESLYALVPGGVRQHELALRGGVNLVMYTLTGNYKADQVHVRDLLERLAH
jgi:hypothetical protein